MSEDTRRERNKTAKQERIFTAARELFDAHGFEAVTTQQIADAADVAVGTVFRYAATKGELLLMVYNDALRAAVDAGLLAAAAERTTADAVTAAVAPLMVAASRARDIALYQRELLFGSAQERYRAEGLAIIGSFERGVARILGGDDPASDARLAARSVFAVIHLALVHPVSGIAAAGLHTQLHQIVAGYRAAAPQQEAGSARRIGRES